MPCSRLCAHMEPLVTVNHFTLPTWVHDPITARPLIQLGLPAPAAGWLSPTTPVEFEKYAAYLAWKYGDQVDNWATLNEPFPGADRVPSHTRSSPELAARRHPARSRFDVPRQRGKGHVAAYDAIHLWDKKIATSGQPAAFVGFTNNMIPARPANPINPLDVQAAEAWNQYYNPVVPERGDRRLGGRELRRRQTGQ